MDGESKERRWEEGDGEQEGERERGTERDRESSPSTFLYFCFQVDYGHWREETDEWNGPKAGLNKRAIVMLI